MNWLINATNQFSNFCSKTVVKCEVSILNYCFSAHRSYLYEETQYSWWIIIVVLMLHALNAVRRIMLDCLTVTGVFLHERGQTERYGTLTFWSLTKLLALIWCHVSGHKCKSNTVSPFTSGLVSTNSWGKYLVLFTDNCWSWKSGSWKPKQWAESV